MFFIGIFGAEDKEVVKEEYPNVICPACGRYSRAKLIFAYSYIHFFFIPVFKYNKKYYVVLNCCGARYEADEAYYKELLAGAPLDFSRMRWVNEWAYGDANCKICPTCGAQVEMQYSYCPFCGKQL